LIVEILLIILGFIFLVKGADLLVKAASSIAKKFGLSEMLIGLTIVALGTSLPEVFITITSAIDGHSDLIIGNAIGSCICNFLFVIGISSLIRPVKFDRRIIKVHFPISIAAMVLMLFLGNTTKLGETHIIDRWQGVVLLLCTAAYIVYTIYEEKKLKNKQKDEEIIKDVEEKEVKSIWLIIIYFVLGILGLKFGSDFVVDNAVSIAGRLGLSESFIGMTVVAIGTALPEIITGIIAARKNETDLLLGNITGSNILNLCLLIGVGAIINPLTFTSNFNISVLMLIAITVYLQFIAKINKNNELDKKRGTLLIIVYIIYILSMVGKS
jgi:cation:H+ antiporter